MSDEKFVPAGVVYETGPTEVGNMPVRSEIVVLEEKEPRKLGWTVRMIRAPIYHADDSDKRPEDVRAVGPNDLREGMDVLVQSLFGLLRMTVRRDSYGEVYAETEYNIGVLEFCEEQQEWVCDTMINKKAIENARRVHTER